MPGSTPLIRRLPAAAVATLAAALALVVGVTPSNAAAAKPKHHHKDRIAHIQLLAFNDFHGAVDTGGTIATSYQLNADGTPRLDSHGRPVANRVSAGGVASLAANLARARKGHPYTVTAASGDLIGASPMISAAFHDEPTISALNGVGLEVSSVGNHEFDEGAAELLRMQSGGCRADGSGVAYQNSCPAGHPFGGAKFRYLSANVVLTSTGHTLFPPYWIKNFGHGIRVAFIGMTLVGTPRLLPPGADAGLQFKDEVATANALVPKIRKLGVQSIVVLVHQGGIPDYHAGTTNPVSAAAPYNFRCDSKQGFTPGSEIVSIAKRLSPAIDVVVSGHIHVPYICNIPDPLGQPRLVTNAASYGRLFTDIRLPYDLHTRDIVRAKVTAINRIVDRRLTPDPGLAALVGDFTARVAPIANRVIGQIAVPLPDLRTGAGEVPLGDLMADAMAADPSVAGEGAPDLAFMDPTDIHGAGLTHAGAVTFGDVFVMRPSASVVAMWMTGQQIIDVLNQQWSGANAGPRRKFLQVSDGFSYRWQNGATGPVLDESSVAIHGAPLERDKAYRVVADSFLSEGGNDFPAFTTAANKAVGGLDIDALARYLGTYTAAHGPWAPPAARIATF
jgi:2',3'-cyclic-nucleotide 2'-phosphodiesterase (5'-nucleotidase family)